MGKIYYKNVAYDSGGMWGAITGNISDQEDLQDEFDLKANLASPALTGTPTAPTAASGTNTTQIATTAFVQTAIDTAITQVLSASY